MWSGSLWRQRPAPPRSLRQRPHSAASGATTAHALEPDSRPAPRHRCAEPRARQRPHPARRDLPRPRRNGQTGNGARVCPGAPVRAPRHARRPRGRRLRHVPALHQSRADAAPGRAAVPPVSAHQQSAQGRPPERLRRARALGRHGPARCLRLPQPRQAGRRRAQQQAGAAPPRALSSRCSGPT